MSCVSYTPPANKDILINRAELTRGGIRLDSRRDGLHPGVQ